MSPINYIKTSEKLTIIIWFIFFLIMLASFIAFLILENSQSYAAIVNYSGKIRGNIQRLIKLYSLKDFNALPTVEKEIEIFFETLEKSVENLKIPILDKNTNFKPTPMENCYMELVNKIKSKTEPKFLLKLSEDCWKICDKVTDFYQRIVQRNLKILEAAFYTIMVLVGILAGILLKINIEEVKGELEFSANYDALTKVLNRHSFIRIYEKLKKRPGKRALIIFDLDRFKWINDTFGHNMGDKVLQRVAQIVRKNIRKGDFVARWGGEEFIVLLNGADKEAALKVAEKLRRLIDGINFPEEEGLRVSASFGVTEVKPGEELKEVVARADKALYRSKEEGRNKVSAA